MTEVPDIDQLAQASRRALEAAADAAALEAWRRQYIGRKGEVPQLLRLVKDLPAEERTVIGQKANVLRRELEEAYKVKLDRLGKSRMRAARPQPSLKLRLAGVQQGHLHPLTLTSRRIQNIFAAMGFLLVDGPEMEDPKYNFDLLNIPPEHPARDIMDTFYLTNRLILRTHVSPIQLRSVQEQGLVPPFKVVYQGRSFRAERTDASHEHTFHQYEFLVLGEGETIANFRGTLEVFYSAFFGKPAHIRLRPSYFPFVEPGFEIDLQCVFCEGDGCRVCKNNGWLEMGGAGMVHPVVLQNMGFDPASVQGYACGSGVDRLAMMYYGINDIRLFLSGDIRFLQQFP